MRKQIYFDAKQLGMGKAYCERNLAKPSHSLSQNPAQDPARIADIEADKMCKALRPRTQKGEQECLLNSPSNSMVVPDWCATVTHADFLHIVG